MTTVRLFRGEGYNYQWHVYDKPNYGNAGPLALGQHVII
ncbi:Uncharacterised protein [Cedecea neteri]|uniref:Uncharacterized protein n=1 Tax=Cedecea neteri TaxID=158822 RepID=A0A2X3KWN1_9ENTR|nr:Uncharacterised protein [Cedecea neteri]